MSDDRTVTIVHLSDTQFGSKHRSWGGGTTPGDRAYSTLASRILTDLKTRGRTRVNPDLVVISGDLTEEAKPSEFAMAKDFAGQLATELTLPHERIVMVPGNHDVSWGLCRAYLAECAAEERNAELPYWGKWRPYAEMFNSFYRDTEMVFPVDKPWSLFVLPEQSTVIAGMNSTIAETHEAHFGELGEEQIRWFEEQLHRYERYGWLRIGVMHHNPVRGAVDDESNLRDVDQFSRVLAPRLHFVLHGHSHQAALFSLGPQGLPVLCAGSAAIEQTGRSEDVPNQYQIIEVKRDGIRIRARAYAPERRQWIGDNRISTDGERPTRYLPAEQIGLHNKVHGLFPKRAGPADFRESQLEGVEVGGRLSAWRPTADHDDLIARVADVCRIRAGDRNMVTRLHAGDPPIYYLRVSQRTEDNAVSMYPVGVWEKQVTEADLERFTREVDRRYRDVDRGVTSYLIYPGAPVPEELRMAASVRGIRLESLVEYQGIRDLSRYADEQKKRLEKDWTTYPDRLYVPQRYFVGNESEPRPNLVEQMLRWLAEPDARFVLVVGEFGQGKSFMLRQLTRHLHAEHPNVVPILIDLRTMDRVKGLDELIAHHLAASGETRIDLVKLGYLRREGRIVLLFDGFDELEQRVTYERAGAHLDTLLRAVEGRAKVVVTCRTQHVASEGQFQEPILRRFGTLAGQLIIRLAEFDDDQMIDYLSRLTNGDQARASKRFKLVRDTGLTELGRNPRMLSFIALLHEHRLADVNSAASLYQELLEQWLEYEYERAHPPGSPPSLTVPQRWEAVTRLALRLLRAVEPTLGIKDLADVAAALEDLAARQLDPATATQAIGVGTLLVRTGERFSFVHESVMEWLVAKYIANGLSVATTDTARTKVIPDTATGEQFGEALTLLNSQPLSPLTVRFLCGLAEPSQLQHWAAVTSDNQSAPEASKINALQVSQNVGRIQQGTVRLAKEDLRGRDLVGADLTGADLTGADMRDLDLRQAKLAGATMTSANLSGAWLDGADLQGAHLVGADLSGARLLGTDLTDAVVDRVRWKRSALIGARISTESLAAARMAGSAPPEASGSVSVQHGMPADTSIQAVAIDPIRDLLLTGGTDSVVRAWDMASGQAIRSLIGHTRPVRALAVHREGRWLVSAGDDGEPRIWDLDTGQTLEVLTGHTAAVSSLAINSSMRWLGSADHGGEIRVWDTCTWQLIQTIYARQSPLSTIAISPDGRWLASANRDGELLVWDASTWQQIHTIDVHQGAISAIAISPDGRWLASTGADGRVILWDLPGGRRKQVIAGHPWPVTSLAAGVDGRWLITGGTDGTVRVWEVETGQPLRVLTDHTRTVWTVTVGPDGRRAASAGDDGIACIWDTATWDRTRKLPTHTRRVHTFAMEAAGQRIATSTSNGRTEIWDLTSGGRPQLLVDDTYRGPMRAGIFSPDGAWIATGADDGTVRVWDPVTRIVRHRLSSHHGAVWSMAVDSAGRWLASGGHDGHVRIWGVAAWEPLRTFAAHTGPVWTLIAGPDGQWLATGGADGRVRIWEASSGLLQTEIISRAGRVRALTADPAGQWIAAAGDGGVVQIWHLVTGELVHCLAGHTGALSSLATGPQRDWIAAGGTDGVVRIWDTHSGQLLHVLTGHLGAISSVVVDPTGRWVVTSGSDGTIRVWQVHTWQPEVTLLSIADGWAALLPDLRYLLSGAVTGEFWYAAGMCRFEPGELDSYVNSLKRMPEGTPLLGVVG